MVLVVGTLIVFLVVGMPIAFTIGFPTILNLILYHTRWLPVVPTRLFAGMNNFVFLAIPFFLMAGEIMSEAKITDRIIDFADSLVGHVRGGLAQVNVVANMFFAGISGAALSDVAALGSVFIPAMEKNGYTKKFAAALTAASSIQGPIIPPSVIIVIYASIMGTSVGALFAAGFVPGVLIGVADILVIVLQAKRRGYPKRETGFVFLVVLKAFWRGLPALAFPAIILGGILGGIFTPTEAGAVAVFYGLVLAVFFMKSINLKTLIQILKRTVIKTASLFIIVAFAKVFSWVLAAENVPQFVAHHIFAATGNIYLILFLLNILVLFVGTWLETSAAIILLGPVFIPALVSLGLNPIHLGMMLIVNLTIGLITPPFGVCLYAVSSMSGCRIEELSREALPFILIDVVVLFLITYLPPVVMFIPRLLNLA